MKKTRQALALSWFLLWSGINQWLAQSRSAIQHTKKQAVEILVDDHEHIIKQSFSDILKKYWPEKWMDTIRKHLLIEVNNEREKVGAPALKANVSLDSAAQWHADFVANNKEIYYDTNGRLLKDPHMEYLPNDKKKGLTQRVMTAGYGSPMVSENMAIGVENIQQTVEARLNEPTHRQIMLDTNIQEWWTGGSLLATEYQNIHMSWCVIVMDYGKPDAKKRKWTIQSQ